MIDKKEMNTLGYTFEEETEILHIPIQQIESSESIIDPASSSSVMVLNPFEEIISSLSDLTQSVENSIRNRNSLISTLNANRMNQASRNLPRSVNQLNLFSNLNNTNANSLERIPSRNPRIISQSRMATENDSPPSASNESSRFFNLSQLNNLIDRRINELRSETASSTSITNTEDNISLYGIINSTVTRLSETGQEPSHERFSRLSSLSNDLPRLPTLTSWPMNSALVEARYRNRRNNFAAGDGSNQSNTEPTIITANVNDESSANSEIEYSETISQIEIEVCSPRSNMDEDDCNNINDLPSFYQNSDSEDNDSSIFECDSIELEKSERAKHIFLLPYVLNEQEQAYESEDFVQRHFKMALYFQNYLCESPRSDKSEKIRSTDDFTSEEVNEED